MYIEYICFFLKMLATNECRYPLIITPSPPNDEYWIIPMYTYTKSSTHNSNMMSVHHYSNKLHYLKVQKKIKLNI